MSVLIHRSIAVMLAAFAVGASAQTQQEQIPPDQARAQAAMADLGQRLKGALVQKMQSEGPVAAVDFCHVEAPKIAQAVSREHGVIVGRTAQRLRSPANALAPWQEPVMAAFLEKAQAGTPPGQLMHAERDEHGARFARGIAVEGPCLVCHGSHLAEPIQHAIAERYPDDAATGFSEGDLRGLIWAEVPSQNATPAEHVQGEDARIVIALDAAQREALRAEMRWRMELLSSAMAALAEGDWEDVARIGEAGTKGNPKGADFRQSLPQGWFAMARPMHEGFSALAKEANTTRRSEHALTHLGQASRYCVACHAAYRIQTHEPVHH